MRLLLDTCTFLWIVVGDSALSVRVRDAFVDPENEVFVSAVSAAPARLSRGLRLGAACGPWIEALAVDEEAALHVAKLPDLHRDPFDRMLIAQAMVGGLVLAMPDDAIRQYPVRTLW
jgi:PIN domain nuclease of toxin-antitoxin system